MTPPRRKPTMNIELVSIHIPKTAGTSFSQVLRQVYGDEAVFPDNGEYTDVPLETMPLEPHHRVIHGHVWAGRYLQLLPDTPHVTWLRNPVDWLISLYSFLLHCKKIVNNPAKTILMRDQLSLLEFADLAEVQPQTQSNFLRKTSVDDFFFVGLQEFFAEDLSSLCSMMGWPPVDIPKENINPFAQELRAQVWADPSLVDGIRERLGEDMILYEAAMRKRNERLIASGKTL